MTRGGPMAQQRRIFEHQVRDSAKRLPPEARSVLLGMLWALTDLATANADESARRHKYVMHAYWRVVGVYCRHFRRLIGRAA